MPSLLLAILVVTVQARTEDHYPHVNAVYEVTLQNTGKTEQIVDLTSISVNDATFSSPGGGLAGSGSVASDEFWSDRMCINSNGFAVIKPGAAATVLVKIETPEIAPGLVKLTVGLSFWRITNLVLCRAERIEVKPSVTVRVEPARR